MMRMVVVGEGVGRRSKKERHFGEGVAEFQSCSPSCSSQLHNHTAGHKKRDLGGWHETKQEVPTHPKPTEPVEWICPSLASCNHSFWTLHFLIRNLSSGGIPEKWLFLGILKQRLHGAHQQYQPHLSLLLPVALNGSPDWDKLFALFRALLHLSLFHYVPLMFFCLTFHYSLPYL